MTLDDYENLLNKQNKKCAICGKDASTTRLAVDHDHNTGIVRGLLCFRCNFGLSFFKENTFISWKMFKYLLKSEFLNIEYDKSKNEVKELTSIGKDLIYSWLEDNAPIQKLDMLVLNLLNLWIEDKNRTKSLNDYPGLQNPMKE
jgi:hypothetical protein